MSWLARRRERKQTELLVSLLSPTYPTTAITLSLITGDTATHIRSLLARARTRGLVLEVSDEGEPVGYVLREVA